MIRGKNAAAAPSQAVVKCAVPLLSLALVAAGGPCLWDRDTLDDEMRGLPGAFELIVGRWHRHGEAYYRARVDALTAKAVLTPAECDDLAVAHEHLGDRAQAIAVMAQKQALLALAPDPVQQYRYHANLGTFFAHDGRYDEALVELRRAVAIDPDAHFGREQWQIELIEFARAAAAQPELWNEGFLLHAGHPLHNFAWHVEPDAVETRGELDWNAAYTAIAGMLRFGGRDSAELYRSLGMLFLDRGDLHLAWWSFRRAIECGHPAEAHLRGYLGTIVGHWTEAERLEASANVVPTEATFRAVRAVADLWLSTYQQEETAAVRRGEDAASDAVLRRLLADADARVAPAALAPPWWRVAYAHLRRNEGFVAAVAFVVAMLIVRDGWRRRRAPAAS